MDAIILCRLVTLIIFILLRLKLSRLAVSTLFPYTTLFRSFLRHSMALQDGAGSFSCGLYSNRSEEHTSELQSRRDLVCRLLLAKKNFNSSEISVRVNFCVMEAIKLCRLDTPIMFIEARINLSRFVVTGCAAKTSATVTFPSLNLISLFAFCFNIWLNGVAS